MGRRRPEVKGLAQGCPAGLGRTQPSDLSISLGCLSAQPRGNPANATNEVSLVRPHLRPYWLQVSNALLFLQYVQSLRSQI